VHLLDDVETDRRGENRRERQRARGLWIALPSGGSSLRGIEHKPPLAERTLTVGREAMVFGILRGDRALEVRAERKNESRVNTSIQRLFFIVATSSLDADLRFNGHADAEDIYLCMLREMEVSEW
jgi:hypothetical protein